MKDRMTMGFSADAAETAALTIPDERATERIVEALDWEHDRRAEGHRIGAALRHLGRDDRTFARAVLSGKDSRDLGMSRQLFEWKLKKVENLFHRMNTGFE